MPDANFAPCCPVCGHDGCRVLKQNSPAAEFLPADLVVPRASKRQCDKCGTKFIPEREYDD